MKYRIVNTNGMQGPAWRAAYDTQVEAVRAIASAYGWDDPCTSELFTTCDRAGSEEVCRCVYESTADRDADTDGARAPRVLGTLERRDRYMAMSRTVDADGVADDSWTNWGDDFATLAEARSALSGARALGRQTRILYGDPRVAGGKRIIEQTGPNPALADAADDYDAPA